MGNLNMYRRNKCLLKTFGITRCILCPYMLNYIYMICNLMYDIYIYLWYAKWLAKTRSKTFILSVERLLPLPVHPHLYHRPSVPPQLPLSSDEYAPFWIIPYWYFATFSVVHTYSIACLPPPPLWHWNRHTVRTWRLSSLCLRPPTR